jgi:hypothetical protein
MRNALALYRFYRQHRGRVRSLRETLRVMLPDDFDWEFAVIVVGVLACLAAVLAALIS